jgi:hypothetical protein
MGCVMGMSGMRWMAAALAGLALAACGTQQATTSSSAQPASPAAASRPATPATAGSALCSSVSSVTKLVVTRVTALPQNHLHFALPAGVTITGPAARGVARAVCALPSAPHGAVMDCPADLGVSYRLSFAAGQAAFPVVTISAGGCAQAAGAGPARQATSAGFWTGLAQAMGVPHPSSSVLQGTS